MIWLVLGLALWAGLHVFPVFFPAQRAPLGGNFRGVTTLGLVASIVLMVLGWDSDAGLAMAYAPPAWGQHVNNLLMLIAVWLLGAGHMKVSVARIIRHPMLTAVIVWAVAHLLVNGDAQDIVLFGGMALWAVASIFGLNARDGAWVKSEKPPLKKDIIHAVASLVLFGVIVLIHGWLGPYPLPG